MPPAPTDPAPKTLGILHTSLALVEMLNGLARDRLKGTRIVNVVDDSLIVYAMRQGVDEPLLRRIRHYCLSAAEAGADVILSACSSVGEAIEAARPAVPVPILRIDEPMAEKAVGLGRRIGVFATAASTFGPTTRLLHSKAKAVGRTIETSEHDCTDAFELLLAGKTAEHDRLVTDTVLAAAGEFDVVLFAQASMSRLAPSIAARLGRPVLTSPGFAMDRLASMLR
jgi:Asp/Glu/hydantoin racemase